MEHDDGYRGKGDKRKDLAMPVGIWNIGNSCYMNSTIQALFAFKPMMTQFHALFCNSLRQGIEQKTLGALINLHDRYLENQRLARENRSFLRDDIAQFQKVCGSYTAKEHFLTRTQQDAVEFCELILENIEEEYTKAYPSPPGQNPIKNLFQIETALQFQCVQCGHCKKMPSITMNTLRLNIPETITDDGMDIQDIVDEEFNRREHTEHKCDQPNCNSNDKISTTQIQKLPANIILQLGRYSDEGDKKKNPVFPAIVLKITVPYEFEFGQATNSQSIRTATSNSQSSSRSPIRLGRRSQSAAKSFNISSSPPRYRPRGKSKSLKGSKSTNTLVLRIPKSSYGPSVPVTDESSEMKRIYSDGKSNGIVTIYDNKEILDIDAKMNDDIALAKILSEHTSTTLEMDTKPLPQEAVDDDLEVAKLLSQNSFEEEQKKSNITTKQPDNRVQENKLNAVKSPVPDAILDMKKIMPYNKSDTKMSSDVIEDDIEVAKRLSLGLSIKNEQNKSDLALDTGPISDMMKRLSTDDPSGIVTIFRNEDADFAEAKQYSRGTYDSPQMQLNQDGEDSEIKFAKQLSQLSFEDEQKKSNVTSKEPDNRPKVEYILNAVICHHGVSLSDGHYVAYIKSGKSNWYQCDDEVIDLSGTNLENEYRLMRSGYCFFYSKKLT